jgi:hypothetical protein
MNDNHRDDDRDRHQQRRSQAQEGIQNDTPQRRKDPYKRDRIDHRNDYLQEEALEDEWFEENN